MMNLLRISVVYLLFATPLFGQFEGFTQYYDYEYSERGEDFIETSDGGFAIIANYALSIGVQEILLIKTDSLGDEEWHQSYGDGSYDNRANSLIQTDDGGFIITGQTTSDTFGLDQRDAYLVRTNEYGDTLWTRKYGVSNYDEALGNISKTLDGGYIIVGGRKVPGFETRDAYIIKLNAAEETEWERNYGENEYNEGMSDVEVTEEGDFIFMGNINLMQVANADIWIFKTDSDGEILWEKIYEFPRQELIRDITVDGDDNIIGVGISSSFDELGDNYEIFAMKFNELGDTLWTNVFSNGEIECNGRSIVILENGDFLIAGIDYSDGPISSSQIILLRISEQGEYVSHKIIGEESTDIAQRIRLVTGGGIAIAGQTNNNCNNCTFLMKLNENGDLSPTENVVEEIENLVFYPNPTSGIVHVETVNNKLKEVLLFDISGRLLGKENTSEQKFSFDIRKYTSSKGFYILRIHNEDRTQSLRVILE
jgi:hypothetical protein